MPKPALIELDTAVVELRDYTVSVVREFLPRYQWPENLSQRMYQAVGLIFDDSLTQYLAWTPKGPDHLARRVVEVLGLVTILQATLGEGEIDDFHSRVNEVISDRVFPYLIDQITAVIGKDRYHAWHVMPLGTGRILSPGGLMIDLDRLKGQSGIVEISLLEHWSPLAAPASSTVAAAEEIPPEPISVAKPVKSGPTERYRATRRRRA